MAGTTAITVVIASLVVVSVSVSATAVVVVLSWCFDGGVADVMDGGCVLCGISVRLDSLLLEELREERDLA